jgi:hypothetical protein
VVADGERPAEAAPVGAFRGPFFFPGQLTTYDFNSSTIRVLTRGQPLVVATDALYAMGYPQRSHGGVIGKLGDDETCLHQVQSGLRSQRIVSESGLFKLIIRSEKPHARPFQDWVTREVLPSIRKETSTGTRRYPRRRWAAIEGQNDQVTCSVGPGGGDRHAGGVAGWPQRSRLPTRLRIPTGTVREGEEPQSAGR